MQVITTVVMDGTPECLTFVCLSSVSKTANSAPHLVIGSRDSSSLLYLNCQTLERHNVSLNEKEFDTHVSFTPLHMSLSPDGNMLLIATDKHLMLLYEVGTNRRLRTFSGHSSGDYARPKVAWDASGKYIYSNSDADPYVYVYSVATTKIVEILKHHNNCGVTRYGCAHRSKPRILTTGGDKSLVMCDAREGSVA